MSFIRVATWVILLLAFGLFTFANWNPVQVQVWQSLYVHTKVPVLVTLSFLLGFVPIWLLHRATKWRLTRRINSLEQSIRITAAAQPPAGQDPETKTETSTEGPHEP